MTLVSEGRVMTEDMPAELIQQVVKRQAMEVVEGMLARIEYDKRYMVMLKKETGPDIYGYPGEIRSRVYIDFEPIPEVRMIYKSPEDLHLIPTKSLKTKIKNCWHYLWDKSEGKYEQEM